MLSIVLSCGMLECQPGAHLSFDSLLTLPQRVLVQFVAVSVRAQMYSREGQLEDDKI